MEQNIFANGENLEEFDKRSTIERESEPVIMIVSGAVYIVSVSVLIIG